MLPTVKKPLENTPVAKNVPTEQLLRILTAIIPGAVKLSPAVSALLSLLLDIIDGHRNYEIISETAFVMEGLGILAPLLTNLRAIFLGHWIHIWSEADFFTEGGNGGSCTHTEIAVRTGSSGEVIGECMDFGCRTRGRSIATVEEALGHVAAGFEELLQLDAHCRCC